MAHDLLVGDTIKHRDQIGYFMDVFDHRPETLKLMSERKLQGGGPTWKGLVTAALELESPSSIKALEFDDEADALRVMSKSKHELQAAQSVVKRLISDRDFMVQCIARARTEGILE